MGKYAKFWVAVLILGANALRSRYGIDIGLNEQIAGELVAGVTAAFVYLVPNRSA